MGSAGLGVIQANSDFGESSELELLIEMGRVSGRPVSFSLLQVDHDPGRWRKLLDRVDEANREGVVVRGQVGTRPIGVLMGFGTTINPFVASPAMAKLVGLSPDERAARLAEPAVRDEVVSSMRDSATADRFTSMLHRSYELGDPCDYEPDPSRSIAALASNAGTDPFSYAYDLMLENGAQGLLYHPFENYSEGSLDVIGEMLVAGNTVAGLSDGGAHVATICDASYPTYLLTHWVRDRTRGPRLPLAHVVKKQTADPAAAIGLGDRGAIVGACGRTST